MRDFFDPSDEQCVQSSALCAYLYDGDGEAPAVLSEVLLPGRPVSVENLELKRYVFRPIDKVVYGPTDPKRGDVLLHTVDRHEVIFAELKLWHVAGWFKVGKEQLKRVVLEFIASHRDVYDGANVRKAYICNPYRMKFAFSYAEDIRDFRRETRFVLYPEGKIRI